MTEEVDIFPYQDGSLWKSVLIIILKELERLLCSVAKVSITALLRTRN